MFELHPQRVGVALDRMLGGAVDAEQRRGAIRGLAADVDDHAAVVTHVRQRGAAAVDHAPEAGVEDFALFFERLIDQPAVHPDAGVVHPRIDAAELLHRAPRHIFELPRLGHVGGHVEGTPAGTPDPLGGVAELTFAARGEHDARPCPRRHFGCGESDPARSAGDNDDLIG